MPPKRTTKSKKGKKAAGGNQTEEQKTAAAAEAKTRGNTAFAAGNFEDAIAEFSTAIALTPNNHVLYSNRSAAYLSEGLTVQALADARKCVELNSGWAKGYHRLGAAYYATRNYQSAIETYKRGINLDAGNQKLKEALGQAQAALEVQDEEAAAGNSDAKLDEAERKMRRMEIEARLQAEREEQERKASGTSDAIGIDLGTTYSCVAVWKQNQVEIIANAEGNRTTPSYVAFTDSERLVGGAAKQQAAGNSANTVFDAKRLIGRSFSDEAVQSDKAHFPFAVIDGGNNNPMIQVTYRGEEKTYAPEEISSMVLARMKETAEAFMGRDVGKCVITCPAYFNDQQRQATKDAGAIAGMEVLRIINEPTAAALAYGLDSQAERAAAGSDVTRILIFDLGGGTFDVSVLTIENGIFEVKATGGDTHLGGEDFDNAMVNHVVTEFKRKNRNADVASSPRAMRRLRTACENAKRMLSTSTTATIELDSLVDGIDFSTVITRAKFEQLNMEFFTRTIDTVSSVLADAEMEPSQINDLVLVGGSTRIPKIQAMLTELFEGKELCRSINPDEAVAYGAAIQAAILSGVRTNATNQLLLVDVAPLSLGIETTGKVMSTLIKRNTPIPCRKTKTYTTEEDWQTSVDIEIYEGERACTDANNKLGEFRISNLERARRGVPQVEVTLDIDANGILHVSAQDTKTGAHASTTITPDAGRNTKEEVERMIAEAEANKAADQAFERGMESRNQLEHMLFRAQEECRNRGADEKLQAVQDAIMWLEDNDGASVHDLKAKQREVERELRRGIDGIFFDA